MFLKKDSLSETSRIEAFSDGVFAIAITLLVLEIKVPGEKELESGLLTALVQKWPSFLAFLIGFFTILVCWINHHYLFNRIQTSSHSLILANSLTLFAVCVVPYPTAVLAESFVTGELQTAVQLFGLGYILMSACYRTLSFFVNNDPHADYSEEETRSKKAINTMYNVAIVHTVITLVITFFSVLAGLVLYIILFSMFLFPVWYTDLVLKFQSRGNNKD